jgi:hypothetical protein
MTVRVKMLPNQCCIINMTTIILSAKELSCALACGDRLSGVQGGRGRWLLLFQ